jgi:CheY-like chemotaxis protein
MSPEATTLRILTVDDEAPIREVLTLVLRDAGHIVGTAADGLEALAMFGSSSWDLVITDRNMPGMTGDDLAMAIKRMSPNTPILMISGLGETQKIAANPAVDGSVRKPFTVAAVKDGIKKVVQRYRSSAKAA